MHFITFLIINYVKKKKDEKHNGTCIMIGILKDIGFSLYYRPFLYNMDFMFLLV